MIKVLHILGGMDRGGAESYIMNLARKIDRKRFHFTILTFIEPAGEKYIYAEEVEKLGFKIIQIPDTRFRRPWEFIREIAEVVRNEKIDVVHSHIDFMSGIALEGGKRGGAKKLITHSHSVSNVRLEGFNGESFGKNLMAKVGAGILRKSLLKLADVKLACGKEAGEFLYGRGAEFRVVKNGADFQKLQFNLAARERKRKEYGFSSEDVVILTIGRIETVKNQEFLVELVKRCEEKVKLVIVGEGSLREKLENLVEELGLTERVFFTGSREEVAEFYSMADVFVLPSKFEGVPNVGIEAQVAGLPCIFSEKVPREVKLTEKVRFLGIDGEESLREWQGKILEIAGKRKAGEKTEKLEAYNIERTVKEIEEIYSE